MATKLKKDSVTEKASGEDKVLFARALKRQAYLPKYKKIIERLKAKGTTV